MRSRHARGRHLLPVGQKHLITFGSISDYLLLFARVEGTRGADGTVALMVPPHGEGITANVMPETMGVRGTDHAHLIFDRAPVPVANRLGEEGEGLGVALGGLSGAEPDLRGDDVRRAGASGRSTSRIEYAQQRETFGKKIAKRQAIAFRLAEMATDIAGRQGAVMQSAQRLGGRRDAAAASAMASCSRSRCCSA